MSTPLVNVSMGAPGILATIPHAAADYTGSGASKLVGGPATGAADIQMFVVTTASTTDGNFIRVFKKIAGTMFFQYAVNFDVRTSNTADRTWQMPLSLGTLRLSDPTEEIWLSMEKDDHTIMSAFYQNFILG